MIQITLGFLLAATLAGPSDDLRRAIENNNLEQANTYRDLDPQISLRIGIYKWPWSDPFWNGGPPSVVSKRVVFFDEVRIARE